MTMLFTIREHISTLIGGMTIDGGYHFDWGDVNVYDNQENYPSAKIVYLQETNLDESSGRGASRHQYLNEVIFNIRCEFRNDEVGDVNSVEMTTKLDEDLKKLFGLNYSFPTIKGGYTLYNGHKPVFQQNSDITCGIDWQLKVRYYQRRDNPSVYI